jgi:isoleucyl-tRNA synthetase
MKFTAEWRELTEKMGYFVDLDHPYITYDNKYIETLWWLLKQLYNKGLLYKGYTIQPYSPAAGTGLSSHELNQPGCYRDVKDTTVTAQFLITESEGRSGQSGASLTSWLGPPPRGHCLQTSRSAWARTSTMWLWRLTTPTMPSR